MGGGWESFDSLDRFFEAINNCMSFIGEMRYKVSTPVAADDCKVRCGVAVILNGLNTG